MSTPLCILHDIRVPRAFALCVAVSATQSITKPLFVATEQANCVWRSRDHLHLALVAHLPERQGGPREIS